MEMTKKHLLAGLQAAMAALTIYCCPANAAVPESDKTIKVMTAEWSAINIEGQLIALILGTVGYNTELVAVDDSGRYPGFENGDVHISMETWQTTQKVNLEKSLSTGKVLDLGETGTTGKEDWWYPLYVKEKCPGLPDWKALAKCAEIFSTPDTAPKGRYIGGPAAWGEHDENMIKALDLPFVAIHAGSDAAMFAELKSAYERKAPIVLWVWEPNWVTSVYQGEFVEFPKFEQGCFDDPAWGPNPKMTNDCGKPYGWIKKMGWAGGEKVWPCAYDIVRNYKMDGKTLNELIVQVDIKGRTIKDVATEWVKANEATWRPWAKCAQ